MDDDIFNRIPQFCSWKSTSPETRRNSTGEEDESNEVLDYINAGRDVSTLRIDQLRVYLRKYNLRATGSKNEIIERVKDHIQFRDGGAVEKYPVDSFVVDCTGDVSVGDVILFQQDVYEKPLSKSAVLPPIGKRTIVGRVLHESYGVSANHSFTIEVLWTKGISSLPTLFPLIVFRSDLYLSKTFRQLRPSEEFLVRANEGKGKLDCRNSPDSAKKCSNRKDVNGPECSKRATVVKEEPHEDICELFRSEGTQANASQEAEAVADTNNAKTSIPKSTETENGFENGRNIEKNETENDDDADSSGNDIADANITENMPTDEEMDYFCVSESGVNHCATKKENKPVGCIPDQASEKLSEIDQKIQHAEEEEDFHVEPVDNSTSENEEFGELVAEPEQSTIDEEPCKENRQKRHKRRKRKERKLVTEAEQSTLDEENPKKHKKSKKEEELLAEPEQSTINDEYREGQHTHSKSKGKAKRRKGMNEQDISEREQKNEDSTDQITLKPVKKSLNLKKQKVVANEEKKDAQDVGEDSENQINPKSSKKRLSLKKQKVAANEEKRVTSDAEDIDDCVVEKDSTSKRQKSTLTDNAEDINGMVKKYSKSKRQKLAPTTDAEDTSGMVETNSNSKRKIALANEKENIAETDHENRKFQNFISPMFAQNMGIRVRNTKRLMRQMLWQLLKKQYFRKIRNQHRRNRPAGEQRNNDVPTSGTQCWYDRRLRARKLTLPIKCHRTNCPFMAAFKCVNRLCKACCIAVGSNCNRHPLHRIVNQS